MSPKPTHEELAQKIALLEEELSARKRSEELKDALLHISKAVSQTTSLDEFLQTIHSTLSTVIDTTNFFVALYDQANDSITFPYFVDEVDKVYPPVLKISKTESLTADVIRSGKPLLITKEEIVQRWSKVNLPPPNGTPSEIWLGVPLQFKEETIGIMAVQNYFDPACYDQTDLNLMVSVAELAAIALINMQVKEALRLSEGKFRSIFFSSNAALETFRVNPDAFDVVITDQTMPGMSGVELSKELLKIRPDIPIILCTGYSKKITEGEALRLGIKKYLKKPYETERLAQYIRDVLP